MAQMSFIFLLEFPRHFGQLMLTALVLQPFLCQSTCSSKCPEEATSKNCSSESHCQLGEKAGAEEDQRKDKVWDTGEEQVGRKMLLARRKRAE